MMQETMEKRANRTVGKSRQKDFFAVLLFFFLLPYTCSSVVRAGQEKTVEGQSGCKVEATSER